jgi:hypothetical protein
MIPSVPAFPRSLRVFALMVVAEVALVSCSNPPPEAPPYARATEAFKNGKLTTALNLTEKLAIATPPADTTDRAQVLRAVIFTGRLKCAMELSEAYSKGADKTKDSKFEIAYRRAQNDNLRSAEETAFKLAETAHQIAPGGVIAKELTLEASYPTTEGPAEIKELATIEKGDWLEPDKQDSVSAEALRKGIDDALADVVAGDRSKARQALAGGILKLDGAAFAIFLAQELADGAVVFDRHHGINPSRLNTLCDEGEESLKAALTLLKDAPNKDQEKEVKKLQDKFKTLRKDT